jgi:type IV pilus assembly protein PilE
VREATTTGTGRNIMMPNKMRGFTLIEAMIVVAILGLIAAFGYPAYRDQVIKSHRADGMSALLELADRMERHYSDAGTYTKADGTNITVADVFPGFSSDYYTLTIDSQSTIGFTVSAAPKGTQVKDKCGTFTLTSQGVKSVSASGMLESCWK